MQKNFRINCHKSLIKIIPFLLLIFLITGCGDDEKKIKREKEILDSLTIIDSLAIEAAKPPPKIIIKYSYNHIESLEILTELTEKYGDDGRRLVLALNRLDSRNIRIGDSLVIPDTIFTNIMPYSPFPDEINILDSIPKILIFSYPIQAFAAYDSGKLINWGPTSMGKKRTPTPTGLFSTNWKSKRTISTVDSTWVLPWAFNIHNKEGVSLHQFDLPGYPASHACARLLETDAQWIYYWAEQWIITRDGEKVIAHGTPVIIYGEYNWGETPPWKYLSENPDTTNITEPELEGIIKPYLTKIMKRIEVRDSVITAREEKKKEKLLSDSN